MGYYSALIDFEYSKIKIKDKEKFLSEIKEECHFGFSPDNCKIEIDENNYIKDIDFEEYNCKWYDDEIFANILASNMEKGSFYMTFRGEDGEVWSFTIYPNLVFDVNGYEWKEKNPDIVIDEIINSNAPERVKKELLKEYKTYWENKLNETKKILDVIDKKMLENEINQGG